MKTKLTLSTAKYLQRLKDGEAIAYSRIKNRIIDDLVSEHILWKKGKHRQSITLQDSKALDSYLANQLQVNDLSLFIQVLDNDNKQRADLVAATADSKYAKKRTFQGFLVNSYQPISARLHDKPLIIHPQTGSFTFIYDYEALRIDRSVTLVGVENAENFRYIEQQKALFSHITPLFISRYPQSQHKDFIRWASQLANPYWHFGDFDVAGIGIYLHEYKKHLGDRASFFIPPDITTDLSTWGSRERYHQQSINFDPEQINHPSINEPDLYDLFTLIQQQQKGLDQEFYIKGKPYG